MPDAINPLMPTAYDLVWSVVCIVVLALTVIALISMGRHSKRLTTTQTLLWTLLVIFVPILGAVAWLVVGRRSTLTASHHLAS